MKQIIKEIALAAGGSLYPSVGGTLLEKSIEMAVKQCADIALANNQPEIALQILQKFEIEYTYEKLAN